MVHKGQAAKARRRCCSFVGFSDYDTASVPSRKPDLSQPGRQGEPKLEPFAGP